MLGWEGRGRGMDWANVWSRLLSLWARSSDLMVCGVECVGMGMIGCG